MLEFKNAGACGPDYSKLEVFSSAAHAPALVFQTLSENDVELNVEQVVYLRDSLTKWLKKNDNTRVKSLYKGSL